MRKIIKNFRPQAAWESGMKAGLLRAAEIVRESPPEFKCACMNIARIADQIESEAAKIEG